MTHHVSIQVTRGEAPDGRRQVGEQRAVAGHGTGEAVVDHDGGDRRDQAGRGGQQRLGNPRRYHCQIGGLHLGDADEAVHDAPDGSE